MPTTPRQSLPDRRRPHVRPAVLSDLDELVALEQRSFSSDRISRAQYRRHLHSDSARVLVAADGTSIIGGAVLFFRRGSSLARLYSLASAPEARGRGIGAALLTAAEHATGERGCRALRLEVRTDNAAAIRLYESHGFRRIGCRPGYYEDGAAAWRYEKGMRGE